MFATASDLIAADHIDDVLARITDRAAVEVRAPRYLVAVRADARRRDPLPPQGLRRGRGDGVRQARTRAPPGVASRTRGWSSRSAPDRHEYGRLLAMHHADQRFFPQERELLQVYARYAASALDGARALMEAQQRYDQSAALLDLARALAARRDQPRGRAAARRCGARGRRLRSAWACTCGTPSRGELVQQADPPTRRRRGARRAQAREPRPGRPARAAAQQPRPRADLRRRRQRRRR